MLKINEIFFSIQGESTWAGQPTVFIRTSGCHLRCSYCDTSYAYSEGTKMSLDEILGRVKEFGAQYVCVTGGEPLLQAESLALMGRLCDLNYHVSLETSGDISCRTVDRRVKRIIDVKTPDSGAKGSFCNENLKDVEFETEFKFVICSEKDFLWAEAFCKEHSLFDCATVLYSPSFSQVKTQWLAEKILHEKSRARLQLQIHKYIWSPHQRGI